MNKKKQNMNKKNSLAFLTAILAIISLVICLSVVLLIKSSKEKNNSDTLQAQIETTGSEINKANQEKEEMMVKLESVQKYLETLETAVSDSTLKINTLVEGEGEEKNDDSAEMTKTSIQSLNNTNKNLLNDFNELMKRIDEMKLQVDDGITQLKDGSKSENEKVVNNISELLAQFENLKNESQNTLRKIEESGASNKEDLELIVNNFERNFNKTNAQNQSEIEENMKNTKILIGELRGDVNDGIDNVKNNKILIDELREDVNNGFDNMNQMQQDSYASILSEIKDALDQVFTLVANGKNKLASALATIGRNVSGNEVLSFSELEEYILHSQDIEGEYNDGVNEPILLSEAMENNLPKGKAAWANGKYVIGNGHDIEESFNTGHSEGYNEGHSEGYNEGHNVGHNEGYNEGYGKGYANGMKEALDGVDVKYTYHVHTGTKGKYGGCYTTPIYHQHTDACYSDIYCQGRWERVAWLENGWWCDYQCTGCGAHRTGMEREQYTAPEDGGPHNAVIGRTLTCTRGKEITGYALGCGKTTETVESVTINFNKVPSNGSLGKSNGASLTSVRTSARSVMLNTFDTQVPGNILDSEDANVLDTETEGEEANMKENMEENTEENVEENMEENMKETVAQSGETNTDENAEQNKDVNEEDNSDRYDEANDEADENRTGKASVGENNGNAENNENVENAKDANSEKHEGLHEELKTENGEGLSENENAEDESGTEDKSGNEDKVETEDTNTEETSE